MTRILTVIAILIASVTFSQETIEITTDQALEAVRNKQRVESLSIDLRAMGLVVSKYKTAVDNLQKDLNDKELVIALWKKNYNILQAQYDALKSQKDPKYGFNDFLKDAGKVLIGVAIGVAGILML